MKITKKQLTFESNKPEQKNLNEIVGMQDQIAVTFGGFNKIKFKKNSDFTVSKLNLTKVRLKEFESKIILASMAAQ